MAKATITSKGQITVPKAIRDSLGLQSGDEVLLTVTEGGAFLKPIRRRSVGELFGLLGGIAPYDRQAERASARAEAVREVLREIQEPHASE